MASPGQGPKLLTPFQRLFVATYALEGHVASLRRLNRQQENLHAQGRHLLQALSDELAQNQQTLATASQRIETFKSHEAPAETECAALSGQIAKCRQALEKVEAATSRLTALLEKTSQIHRPLRPEEQALIERARAEKAANAALADRLSPAIVRMDQTQRTLSGRLDAIRQRRQAVEGEAESTRGKLDRLSAQAQQLTQNQAQLAEAITHSQDEASSASIRAHDQREALLGHSAASRFIFAEHLADPHSRQALETLCAAQRLLEGEILPLLPKGGPRRTYYGEMLAALLPRISSLEQSLEAQRAQRIQEIENAAAPQDRKLLSADVNGPSANFVYSCALQLPEQGPLSRFSPVALKKTLKILRQSLALWEKAAAELQKEYPRDPSFNSKIERRCLAIQELETFIQATEAPQSRQRLNQCRPQIKAPLEQNEVARQIVHAYLAYRETRDAPEADLGFDPAKFFPQRTTVYRHDDQKGLTGVPAIKLPKIIAALPEGELDLFLGLLVEQPEETCREVSTMLREHVTRQQGYRTLYLNTASRFLATLRSMTTLLGGVFASLTEDDKKILGVANFADFWAYVARYHQDPLACIQQENRNLAALYERLPIAPPDPAPRQGLGARLAFWRKKAPGAGPKKLTPEAEEFFDQAVEKAIVLRVIMDSVLFPNGKEGLSQEEINSRDKYRRLDNVPFLHHHDVFPAHMDITVASSGLNAEMAVINRMRIDSEGQTSPIFIFAKEAKKMAIETLLAQRRNGDDPSAKEGLARRIFAKMNEDYSPEQEPPRQELQGQKLTQAFFWKKGGCCRHRAVVLQLAYQEAGLPSQFFLGYLKEKEGKLLDPHAWVGLSLPVQGEAKGKITHFADPNLQYSVFLPEDRILARAGDGGVVPHVRGEADAQGTAYTYRRFRVTMRGKEITYYAADQRTNYIWRPHLGMLEEDLLLPLVQA